MKYNFLLINNIKKTFVNYQTIFIITISIIISIISIIYYYIHHDILAYGDAESHINIAERVIHGLPAGLGQLGGVWLPLPHLLMVPFLWTTFMWRSGLAGSIVSGISYIISSYYIFQTTLFLTTKRWIAIISFFIYALNPNILYMQATPMTELPLLACLTASTYFFIKWIKKQEHIFIIYAALWSFAGCLMRYDAWFLVGIQGLTIIFYGLLKKWSYIKIEGMALLFGLPAAFSALLWLGWNELIFHNPFYFLASKYSAQSQQKAFLIKGELVDYHNVYQSILYYSTAVSDNTGWLLAILSIISLVLFLIKVKNTKTFIENSLIIFVLSATYLFNILALYLGISILFIPGLTPQNFELHLFNIRYGLMMAPSISILIGILLSLISYKNIDKYLAGLVMIFVIAFSIAFPITLRDGLYGLSSRLPTGKISPISIAFRKYYDYGYVAFDDYARSADPIDLKIPINKIIYDGSHPYWEQMLKQPNTIARWLIIRKHDVLWKHFHNRKSFYKDYTVLAASNDVSLYKCTNNCSTHHL